MSRLPRLLCAGALMGAATVVLAGAGATPPLPRGIQLPEYQRVELDNGAIILLMEHHEVPLVAFNAVLRGGAVADPVSQPGVASLTAALLEKGAGKRDAKTFAETVAGVGGRLTSDAGLESVQVRGEFMSRDIELMVALLADVLMRPRFEAGEFEKLRERAIQLIRAAKDSDPRGLLGTYGAAFLFEDHLYGRPVTGDETSLAGIGRDDVLAYYAEHLGANRLILSVAGDFDSTRMLKQLRRALGSWRRAEADLPAVDAAARARGRRVLLVDKPDATQTYFWIGNVGASRQYPRQAELDLANTVFGGRFTSMLNTELRFKSGLSYGASSRISQPSRPGSLAIVSFTRSDATGDAIDLALATLERLRSDGVDADMLQSSKGYVLGQYPLGLETAGQLAAQLASLEFYGLDRAFVDEYAEAVEASTVEQVREVIGEIYPSTDDLVFVLIGDAKAIRDAAREYGEVTEIDITSSSFTPRTRD